ncbi:MAG TPA: APC family permease [Terriglobales bacterium]|nr:APC family permease [Terriglobales bacterium]
MKPDQARITDHHFRKLKLGGFVAVLYAYCAAGPFGFEEMISTSGPGMSLLFLMVVPWLFSLPMSLATSEMATAMPVQGGFYRWTRAAFGDFLGYQCGFWNWSGTFLMNAAYAVILADYCAQLFPTLAFGLRHWLVAIFFLLLVAAINILGIRTVGEVSAILLLTVLIPVAIFTFICFTHAQVNPFVPLTPPGKPWRDVYGVGLALGLWLYSGYEQLSTVIEEVERPERNFPRGLALMVPLAMVTFLLPIMGGIAASADWQNWTTGYIVTVARRVGGEPMAIAMFGAAMISVLLGLQSTLMSAARLPFTMAEDGYFHRGLTQLHRRFRTPVRGILLSTALCAGLALFSVPQLIAVYMWLRVATSVLTLLSVWRLRRIAPDMPRGFRIPGGRLGLALVVIVPLSLFAWALINGDKAALLWGPAYMAAGPLSYLILRNTKLSSQTQ